MTTQKIPPSQLEIPIDDDNTNLLRELYLTPPNNQKLLQAIHTRYPNGSVIGWGTGQPFVTLQFKPNSLPPPPWPLKIGGLLTWFTDKSGMEKGGIPDHLTFPGKSGAGKGPWGRDLVIKDCEQLVPWEIPSEFTMKRVYDALSGLDVKVDAISWMPYCIVVETQDDLPYQKRIPLPSRIASSVAAHMICFTNHFHMGLEEASKAEDDDDGYGRQLAVVNQPGIEGMQVGNFVHVDTESNGGIRTGVLLGVRHRRVPCHGDGDGSNEEEYREFFAYFGQKEGRLLNQS